MNFFQTEANFKFFRKKNSPASLKPSRKGSVSYPTETLFADEVIVYKLIECRKIIKIAKPHSYSMKGKNAECHSIFPAKLTRVILV